MMYVSLGKTPLHGAPYAWNFKSSPYRGKAQKSGNKWAFWATGGHNP